MKVFPTSGPDVEAEVLLEKRYAPPWAEKTTVATATVDHDSRLCGPVLVRFSSAKRGHKVIYAHDAWQPRIKIILRRWT